MRNIMLLDGTPVNLNQIKNLNGKVLIGNNMGLVGSGILDGCDFDTVLLFNSTFSAKVFANTKIREFGFELKSPSTSFDTDSLGDAYFDRIRVLDQKGYHIDYSDIGRLVCKIGPDRIGSITVDAWPLWDEIRPEKTWEYSQYLIMRGLELYGPTELQLAEFHADLASELCDSDSFIQKWIPEMDRRGYLPMLIKKGILPIWSIKPKAFAKLSPEAKATCLNAGYRDNSLEQAFEELFGEG